MRNLSPLLFSVLLSFAFASAKRTERDGGVTAGDLCCVAKNNAEDAALQAAIDWACGPGGADCRPIQQGGSCFDPDDIQFHASYAFNDYFIKNGGAEAACNFSGTAALTSLNPGHGSCQFPSSSSLKNGNTSAVIYGATVGFGTPANLNSSPSVCLNCCIWSLTVTIYVVLATIL